MKNEIEKKQIAILEAIGIQAEANAKKNITDAGRIDTGILRNSITHTVSGDTVFIGTNVEYGVWHEVGTGSHATDGKGRKGYWVYVSGQKYERKGDKKIYTLREAIALAAQIRKKYKEEENKEVEVYVTNGIKPTHFMKNAVADHMEEYKKIALEILKM